MNMQKPAAIILLLAPWSPLAVYADTSLYGPVDASRYLSGDFVAAVHPDFVRLRDIRQAEPERKLWLHKHAAAALRQMAKAFRQQHPDVPFVIASANRSFSYQRGIWERKWQRHAGIRDQQQRLHQVLRFSAMPGASRHHWGTEFDLWPLENDYYRKGKGLVLFNWLKKNAGKYGYCQPYTAGRETGHGEERWHWSYKPLAKEYYRQWLQLFSHASYSHDSHAYINRFRDIAVVYIRSISGQCKPEYR